MPDDDELAKSELEPIVVLLPLRQIDGVLWELHKPRGWIKVDFEGAVADKGKIYASAKAAYAGGATVVVPKEAGYHLAQFPDADGNLVSLRIEVTSPLVEATEAKTLADLDVRDLSTSDRMIRADRL
ncbi:hypothetical protein [Nocardioides aquiterrae]|uniref:Uncharacterized protein n=1 Tax=Nocardioides aquiterrae TaxID=203799 RepID=A0ABP4F2V1_9ACTN